MRDLYHSVLATQISNPATATSARTSSACDLQGFNAASILFVVGQSGDTLSGSVYWTLKLQHSDDDSTYSDVGVSDLHNSAATVVIDSAAEDRTSYAFGYQGNKRYLKGIATPTGTHSNGTPLAIVALRGQANYQPVI